MPDTPHSDGWPEWSKYVLKELINLHEGQKEVRQQLITLQIEMAVAKTKLTLFSAVISSIITTVIIAIVELVLK